MHSFLGWAGLLIVIAVGCQPAESRQVQPTEAMTFDDIAAQAATDSALSESSSTDDR